MHVTPKSDVPLFAPFFSKDCHWKSNKMAKTVHIPRTGEFLVSVMNPCPQGSIDHNFFLLWIIAFWKTRFCLIYLDVVCTVHSLDSRHPPTTVSDLFVSSKARMVYTVESTVNWGSKNEAQRDFRYCSVTGDKVLDKALGRKRTR